MWKVIIVLLCYFGILSCSSVAYNNKSLFISDRIQDSLDYYLKEMEELSLKYNIQLITSINLYTTFTGEDFLYIKTSDSWDYLSIPLMETIDTTLAFKNLCSKRMNNNFIIVDGHEKFKKQLNWRNWRLSTTEKELLNSELFKNHRADLQIIQDPYTSSCLYLMVNSDSLKLIEKTIGGHKIY